jgi:hypothetical protein
MELSKEISILYGGSAIVSWESVQSKGICSSIHTQSRPSNNLGSFLHDRRQQLIWALNVARDNLGGIVKRASILERNGSKNLAMIKANSSGRNDRQTIVDQIPSKTLCTPSIKGISPKLFNFTWMLPMPKVFSDPSTFYGHGLHPPKIINYLRNQISKMALQGSLRGCICSYV